MEYIFYMLCLFSVGFIIVIANFLKERITSNIPAAIRHSEFMICANIFFLGATVTLAGLIYYNFL